MTAEYSQKRFKTTHNTKIILEASCEVPIHGSTW